MSDSLKPRPGNGSVGGLPRDASGPTEVQMRTSRAAKAAPPIVCMADLGKGRPVDCCSATAFSTTETG
eukprot:7547498-Alexandrium_andersonii.AAC.1